MKKRENRTGWVYLLIKEHAKIYVVISLVISICYAFLSVVLTSVSGYLINWAVYNDKSTILPLFLAIGISVPIIVFALLLGYINNRKVTDFMVSIRNKVLSSILNIDLSQANLTSSPIITGITKDVEYLKQYYLFKFPDAIDTLITGTTMIIITGLIDWRLLLITLACSMLLFLTRRIIKNINTEEKNFQNAEIELTSYTLNLYHCLPLFHIYEGCVRFIDIILLKIKEIRGISKKRVRWSSLLNFIMTFLNLIREFSVLLLGTILFKIPLGYAIILTNYTGYVNNMFNNLLDSYLDYKKANVAAEHIQEIYTIPKEPDEVDDNTPVSPPTLDFNHAAIQLKHLNYYYGKRQVLHDIQIELKAGEIMGIYGAIGSGKSTLAKIIAGVYPCQSGQITWCDQLQNASSMRTLAAYVDQHACLFDGSIRDNICCFKDCSSELLKYAVKASGLDEFINSLPDKLDTVLDQNRKLSGGEQQRVAIARALVKNAPIMIFDEITSALDNNTQQYLLNTIENLRGNKTIIMISHRLKTIMGADKIIQIEGGKIITESLVNKC